MKNVPCVPGCILSGYVTNPKINNGQPLPLFTPNPPAGKPSINTLEGWNTLVDQANQQTFKRLFGREPNNNAELYQWVADVTHQQIQKG